MAPWMAQLTEQLMWWQRVRWMELLTVLLTAGGWEWRTVPTTGRRTVLRMAWRRAWRMERLSMLLRVGG